MTKEELEIKLDLAFKALHDAYHGNLFYIKHKNITDEAVEYVKRLHEDLINNEINNYE